MIIILDQMNVTTELRDKVVAYLNKPRKELTAHNPGTFETRKDDGGCPFSSEVFHTRVMEAMEAWDTRPTVREESIIVTKDIMTYASMSFYFIVTEDNQVIIISVNDKDEGPDETYWMGMAYFGEPSVFCNLLDELGIDINKALNSETL